MRKKALMLGGVLGVLALAPNAFAQEIGWYGAFDLGYHWPEEIEATSTNNATDAAPYEYDFQAENDLLGFARLGYQLTPNWRVELEGGARAGNIESVMGDPARPLPNAWCAPAPTPFTPCLRPEGSIEAWTLMGNVIYDLMPDASFTPFIGAGVGANKVKVNILGRANTGGVIPVFVDDEDTVFAWQGIAGFTFRATERLDVDLTYRYLGGSEVSFLTQTPGPFDPGEWSGEYKDQSVTFGVRYSFAPPPPPPPPPPPAYEAREFIVYFPFDQYILTPEAQVVVQEAAQYANAGGATRVVVVGHADTSGSAAYNVRLSERRAKAVADGLVGLGVNQAALAVDWRGESEPAVATGDGVKEPLNRRSTISINF